jgi:hypothetical protein
MTHGNLRRRDERALVLSSLRISRYVFATSEHQSNSPRVYLLHERSSSHAVKFSDELGPQDRDYINGQRPGRRGWPTRIRRRRWDRNFVFVIAAVSVPLLGGAAHAQMTQ